MLKNTSIQMGKRSVVELAQYLQAGQKLHGFKLVRSKHVPELELTALHLQHVKTGADYLHIARDDQNNVFSIGFKTRPPDDTGVPHILEHTALCGSEKYPAVSPADGAMLIFSGFPFETPSSRCFRERSRIS